MEQAQKREPEPVGRAGGWRFRPSWSDFHAETSSGRPASGPGGRAGPGAGCAVLRREAGAEAGGGGRRARSRRSRGRAAEGQGRRGAGRTGVRGPWSAKNREKRILPSVTVPLRDGRACHRPPTHIAATGNSSDPHVSCWEVSGDPRQACRCSPDSPAAGRPSLLLLPSPPCLRSPSFRVSSPCPGSRAPSAATR